MKRRTEWKRKARREASAALLAAQPTRAPKKRAAKKRAAKKR